MVPEVPSLNLSLLARGQEVERPYARLNRPDEKETLVWRREKVKMDVNDEKMYEAAFMISTKSSCFLNQTLAMCVYCEWKGPRTSYRTRHHLLKSCKAVPAEVKEKLQRFVEIHGEGKEHKTLEKRVRSHARSFTSASDSDAQQLLHIQNYNVSKYDKLYATLLMAIITAGVPFNIANNEYFRKYQLMLGGPNYAPPSRKKLSRKVLDNVSSIIRFEENSEIHKLCETRKLTFQVDGWKDSAGVHHHIVYLANSNGKSFFIGFAPDIEYNGGLELCNHLEEYLQKRGFTWRETIFAVVTDSPSVMVSMRKELKKKHGHLVTLGCIVHFVNLIVKDIILSSYSKDPWDKARTIVNYFCNSAYWNDFLATKRKQSAYSANALATFCDTRFYSARNVLRGLQSNRQLLLEAVEESNKKVREADKAGLRKKDRRFAQLPEEIVKLIEDIQLFESIDCILKIIQPLVDAIALLEGNETNVSHVLPILIDGYLKLKQVYVSVRHESLHLHSLEVFEKRVSTLQDEHSLFFLGLFFHPRFKTFAASKLFPAHWYMRKFIGVFTRWFTCDDMKNRLTSLKEALTQYFNGEPPYDRNLNVDNAKDFWKFLCCLKERDRDLQNGVIHLLDICPHQMVCERGLSGAALAKKRKQNRMSRETFEKLQLIREHKKKWSTLKRNRSRKKEKRAVNRVEPAPPCPEINRPIDPDLQEQLDAIANLNPIVEVLRKEGENNVIPEVSLLADDEIEPAELMRCKHPNSSLDAVFGEVEARQRRSKNPEIQGLYNQRYGTETDDHEENLMNDLDEVTVSFFMADNVGTSNGDNTSRQTAEGVGGTQMSFEKQTLEELVAQTAQLNAKEGFSYNTTEDEPLLELGKDSFNEWFDIGDFPGLTLEKGQSQTREPSRASRSGIPSNKELDELDKFVDDELFKEFGENT